MAPQAMAEADTLPGSTRYGKALLAAALGASLSKLLASDALGGFTDMPEGSWLHWGPLRQMRPRRITLV